MPFNTKPFNTAVFNGGFFNNVVYSTDNVAFENTSLNDGTNIILTRHPLSGPSREILGGPMPRGHGQFFQNAYFREYAIVLQGYLKAADKPAMATAMDNLRKLLSASQGNLDITEDNGVVKRFVATCVNYDEMFTARERHHITTVPFVAKFVCPTPFGRSRTYSSVSLDVSSSPTVQSIVHDGSAEARLIVTLNFTAASSVTAASVTNTSNGDSITYTGSLAAGDILVFDSERLRVTKNGEEVNYSGAFVTLGCCANLISVAVSAASFSAYTTFSHRATYL